MPRTTDESKQKTWSKNLDRAVEDFLSRCPISKERVKVSSSYQPDDGEYSYSVEIDGKTIYKATANELTFRIKEEVMQRDGEESLRLYHLIMTTLKKMVIRVIIRLMLMARSCLEKVNL